MDMPSSVVLEREAAGARRGTDAAATARDGGTGMRRGGTWGFSRAPNPLGAVISTFTTVAPTGAGFDVPKRRAKKLRIVFIWSP